MMVKHEDMKVAVNIVHGGDYDEGRIRATRDFAEVMELNQLVVGPEGYECPHDVPSVCVKELKNMRSPRDFTKLFT